MLKSRLQFSNIIISFFFALASCKTKITVQHQTNSDTIVGKIWWKEPVIYRVYPGSFKDNDGDGDLKGIISKLDYLKSLGIDAIWLNPIYQFRNYDNGCNVSDYYKIQPQFGLIQDFDSLLNGLHKRSIKLVMDVVVNHSSSQHEWFKQSRNSRNNPYRNYYHLWDAESGKPTPRDSFFDVRKAKLRINNYSDPSKDNSLQLYEAAVHEL